MRKVAYINNLMKIKEVFIAMSLNLLNAFRVIYHKLHSERSPQDIFMVYQWATQFIFLNKVETIWLTKEFLAL